MARITQVIDMVVPGRNVTVVIDPRSMHVMSQPADRNEGDVAREYASFPKSHQYGLQLTPGQQLIITVGADNSVSLLTIDHTRTSLSRLSGGPL